MNEVNLKDYKVLLEQPLPLAIIALTGIFVIVALFVNNFTEESFVLFLYSLLAAYLRLFYKGVISLLWQGLRLLRRRVKPCLFIVKYPYLSA